MYPLTLHKPETFRGKTHTETHKIRCVIQHIGEEHFCKSKIDASSRKTGASRVKSSRGIAGLRILDNAESEVLRLSLWVNNMVISTTTFAQ